MNKKKLRFLNILYLKGKCEICYDVTSFLNRTVSTHKFINQTSNNKIVTCSVDYYLIWQKKLVFTKHKKYFYCLFHFNLPFWFILYKNKIYNFPQWLLFENFYLQHKNKTSCIQSVFHLKFHCLHGNLNLNEEELGTCYDVTPSFLNRTVSTTDILWTKIKKHFQYYSKLTIMYKKT